jgi:hypothetical protein
VLANNPVTFTLNGFTPRCSRDRYEWYRTTNTDGTGDFETTPFAVTVGSTTLPIDSFPPALAVYRVKVKVTSPYLPLALGTTSDESTELEIAVGGCPAKTVVSPVTWRFFQCHNLGGEDITSPAQPLTQAHHGDWYKFGAKSASLKNDGTHVTDWSNTTQYPYQNDQLDWSEVNNPCPAGWGLPTKDEWKAVMGLTVDKSPTSDAVSTANSGNAVSAAGTWGSNLFTGFKQIGDYLFFSF